MKRKWIFEDEEKYQFERLQSMTGAEYDEQLDRLKKFEDMRNEDVKAKKRGNGTRNALIGAGGTILGAILGEVAKAIIKKAL